MIFLSPLARLFLIGGDLEEYYPPINRSNGPPNFDNELVVGDYYL